MKQFSLSSTSVKCWKKTAKVKLQEFSFLERVYGFLFMFLVYSFLVGFSFWYFMFLLLSQFKYLLSCF